jgi:hypothetical protein
LLVDETETEFRYPTALHTLNVTVTDVKIEFIGIPTLVGGQFQTDFRVTNFRPGMTIRLEKKSDLRATSWAVDSGASLSVLAPDSVFRFTTPTASALRSFYRVVGQ